MKKYAIAALCLVLTAAMFAGCGCTNRNMDNNTSSPTVLPTNNEVWDTTEATTRATTEATTAPTAVTTEPTATADHGNGPLEDTTTATDGTVEGRARTVIPNTK